ncbi:PREDICTED: uncharacterized protein LOC108562981 [Nicrophorus vespilloides]|uniref:Uncharacterized protein LOC108562981 n=1 Tax=Nicrophorus vespilloides TaxID=110193 RepID=A0ABM1MQY7_NICVS|nr:PREDICTED: uncharacterized protein LOC108562981 [Nicrophorus vespilloides]
MLFKTTIVFAALIAFQGASSYPQNAEEVRGLIANFRDASNEAMHEGGEKLKPLVENIEESSKTAEEKAQGIIEESIKIAKDEVDLKEQEAIKEGVNASECVKAANGELATLLVRLTDEVKNCGSNARHESTGLVFEVLDTSGSEAYYRREDYYHKMDACIDKESVPCLVDLKAIIAEDTELYPKELVERFDVTANSLGNIEDDMNECIAHTEDAVSVQCEEYLREFNECIETNKN